MKSLMVMVSYHHNNTQKIAEIFGKVLDAQIEMPKETTPEDLQQHELIGFGSGIYFGKHHKDLLKFVGKIPESTTRRHSSSQPAGT